MSTEDKELATEDKEFATEYKELARLKELAETGNIKAKKKYNKYKRDLKKKEEEKEEANKAKKRDITLPVRKTDPPRKSTARMKKNYLLTKNNKVFQPGDNQEVVNNINAFLDQKGFTVNIDYDNLRSYQVQLYDRYYQRLYPGESNIHVYMREIPLDWIPITGNELLRQIVIHYILLPREEFKSWVVGVNWERYNLPSPLTSARFERIELSPQYEREMPQIEFQPQNEFTNICIKSIHPGWNLHRRSRFEQFLLDNGDDLIPNFNTLIVNDDGYDLRDYDYTNTRNTRPPKPSKYNNALAKYKDKLKRGEKRDKIIEKLSLAFFKDLTHWIIFILCKINKRKVEPVPIKNYIISGCLPQHIEIYKDTDEERNVKSSWCYHIKPNENRFDKLRIEPFKKGKSTGNYEPITKEQLNKRLKEDREKEKRKKKAIAKEKAKANDIPWVTRKGKKKKLMDDNIILKF